MPKRRPPAFRPGVLYDCSDVLAVLLPFDGDGARNSNQFAVGKEKPAIGLLFGVNEAVLNFVDFNGLSAGPNSDGVITGRQAFGAKHEVIFCASAAD